jgi:tellurite resistance protein
MHRPTQGAKYFLSPEQADLSHFGAQRRCFEGVSLMPVQYVRSSSPTEIRDPFDCDEQAVKALVTAGAFVALTDGDAQEIERDAAVDYIRQWQIAATISEGRVAGFFEACARRLEDADFADLIIEALRPLAYLSIASHVIGITERVAAADGRVHPSEMQTIALLRLLTTNLPPKACLRKPSGRS